MSALILFILHVLLAVAICATAIRLLRGPTLANRVAALDLLAVLGVGVAAIHVLATDQAMLLDVALAVGLVSFVGTAAFALLIDRDGNDGPAIPLPGEVSSASLLALLAGTAEDETPTGSPQQGERP